MYLGKSAATTVMGKSNVESADTEIRKHRGQIIIREIIRDFTEYVVRTGYQEEHKDITGREVGYRLNVKFACQSNFWEVTCKHISV